MDFRIQEESIAICRSTFRVNTIIPFGIVYHGFMNARNTRRWTLLPLGWLSLLLAIVGMALPLLPTVPFLLLAAWCFARSSPGLHRWMRRHPRFGPPLREFSTGRIRPTTSRRAIATLWVGLGLSAAALAWKGSWIPFAILAFCGAFVTIWIRRRKNT